MKKLIIQNLSIFMNGYCTSYLALSKEFGTIEVVLLIMCGITFFWNMDINKKDEN
jgi:hypothetical protein